MTLSHYWIKGHQNQDKQWNQLPPAVKVNCYANKNCTQMHQIAVYFMGLFPQWVPGMKAALLHQDKLVTKQIDQNTVIASSNCHKMEETPD